MSPVNDGVQVYRVADRRVVRVGAPQPTLEQLADVEGATDAPAGVPLALQRDPDGVFRPRPMTEAIADVAEDVAGQVATTVADQIATTAVTAHALDPSPHPAYDDMVDPVLWYQNAKI